jgi:hypothetical protein
VDTCRVDASIPSPAHRQPEPARQHYGIEHVAVDHRETTTRTRWPGCGPTACAASRSCRHRTGGASVPGGTRWRPDRNHRASLDRNVVIAAGRAHWDGGAVDFDEDFGHSIRTPDERAAWDRILDSSRVAGDALDALDAGCGTGFPPSS